MKDLSNKPKAIIFSVHHNQLNKSTNGYNRNNTLLELSKRGLNFKEVEGSYKGCIEKSFYVEPREGYNDNVTVFKIAINHNQESVLLLGENRSATLLYLKDGRRENIGTFEQVPEHVAKDHDSYTYDPTNGGYYVCE